MQQIRQLLKRLVKPSRQAKGQGILEFALAFPLLLALVFGIMEFGRLMFTYTAVITAAREAARYGAAAGINSTGNAYYQDCDGIRDAAVRIGSIAAIDPETGVDIQYDNGPAHDNISSGCPFNGTGPQLDRGDRIIVTVNAQFQPTSGLLPIRTMNISSTVRRTVLVNIPVR